MIELILSSRTGDAIKKSSRLSQSSRLSLYVLVKVCLLLSFNKEKEELDRNSLVTELLKLIKMIFRTKLTRTFLIEARLVLVVFSVPG